MPKRISWKKGMRLTDEVLLSADKCTTETIGHALTLAAAGRYGLFPSARPFLLSLNVQKGFVSIEALDCMAITRGGDIIDVQFDTKYSDVTDARVEIPSQTDEKEFILTVNTSADRWQETEEGLLEPRYTFELISAKAAVGLHAMPIGRIVYEDGWRVENSQFVPPCLFLSSHHRYEELYAQFLDILRSIDSKTAAQLNTGAREAITIYWPIVQQVLVTFNTEHELLTPQMFQSCVQRVVAAFTCACDLDEVVTLEDADTLRNYARVPFNYRIAYARIKQGMGMCFAIGEKIDKFSLLVKREEPKQELRPAPEAPKPKRFWEGKQI